MTKAQQKAKKFYEYVKKHPDERFWQALLNFTKVPYIMICDAPNGNNPRDTYFLTD